ncbi:MAG: hypothetical protein MUF64_04900 [Polyangiaceae bacterium]|jgi:hypothetical protein|nr:hypothetical protein [Polyangiaceae bacterium]
MSERKITELLRACAAGLGAVGARKAAETAFQAGGRHLLDESARAAARHAVDWAARSALGALLPGGVGALAGQGLQKAFGAVQLAAGPRLAGVAGKVLASAPLQGAIDRLSHAAEGAAGQAVEQAAQALQPGLRTTAGAVVRVVSGSATDQFYGAARRAAGVGALLDGVSSGIDASRAYQQGEISARQALVRVALDASTGAIAAGAGVAVGAGAIAVLGGLSAPALFVVGAAGATGAKRGLRWLFE